MKKLWIIGLPLAVVLTGCTTISPKDVTAIHDMKPVKDCTYVGEINAIPSLKAEAAKMGGNMVYVPPKGKSEKVLGEVYFCK